ncbi:MAG: hypothetical protein AAF909_13665 [Pseudomonadota bacterium]
MNASAIACFATGLVIGGAISFSLDPSGQTAMSDAAPLASAPIAEPAQAEAVEALQLGSSFSPSPLAADSAEEAAAPIAPAEAFAAPPAAPPAPAPAAQSGLDSDGAILTEPDDPSFSAAAAALLSPPIDLRTARDADLAAETQFEARDETQASAAAVGDDELSGINTATIQRFDLNRAPDRAAASRLRGSPNPIGRSDDAIFLGDYATNSLIPSRPALDASDEDDGWVWGLD